MYFTPSAQRTLKNLVRKVSGVLAGLALMTGLSTAQAAQVATIDYVGSSGLSANALFSLDQSGNTLVILLTNNSAAPYGGSGVNGGSNMVLSSINFDLGEIDITGGSIALAPGSTIVKRSGSSWNPQSGSDLSEKYGYSNSGVGNSGVAFANALHAVTSHSNGGNNVTDFTGDSGISGGLDYGLVAPGSTAFGNSKYVLDAVELRLFLSNPLTDLNFLNSGSYVEFGSDYAFVAGQNNSINIPEPGSFLAGGLLLGVAALRRRRGR